MSSIASFSGESSPIYVPVKTLNAEESLKYVESEVKRYEQLRKVAYNTQEYQKAKVYEDAQNTKWQLGAIKTSQQEVANALIGSAFLVSVLGVIEIITAGFSGIRWGINRINKSRNRKEKAVETSKPLIRRQHARDWQKCPY